MKHLLFLLSIFSHSILAANNCRPRVSLQHPIADQQSLQQLASGNPIALPFSFEISTRIGACFALLGFEVDDQDRVDASITLSPGGVPLQNLPQANISQLVNVSLTADQPKQAGAYLVLKPLPLNRPGVIPIKIRAFTYRGDDPSTAQQTDRANAVIPIQIPASARLEVVSDWGQQNLGGTSGLIDLGIIQAGVSGSAGLHLRGNSPVVISIQAERGFLENQDNDAYRLDYRLTINGQTLNATQVWQQWLTPDSYIPVTVTVPDVERVAAGAYQDRIQITIRPE